MWRSPMELERIRTTEAVAHVGQHVKLAGWLHALRRLGSLNFLILRDGFGTFQAVLDDISSLSGCQAESILEVEGTVCAEPQAPGGVELHDCDVRVLVPVTEPPPLIISKREVKANLDVFLDHAPVGLRHPARRALFRIQAGLMAAFRAYLTSQGFTEVQTPKLLGSATESGANVFAVDYFGQKAYLAQSPQFYKQMMVGVFERVFEVGPVFRAEPHATTRHLNEYVSLDVEMGFIRDHHDVMAMLGGVIASMLDQVKQHHFDDLALVGATMPEVPMPIPEIDFREGQALIAQHTDRDPRGEPDLAPPDEKWLCDYARQEWGSDFVFVTGYPLEKRPFYTMPAPHDSSVTNGFDLLFRGTELVTGGQRIHAYSQLVEAARAKGIPPDRIAGYLEAFRFGMPPHGGFAIGLERFVMLMVGLSNLREASLFPRDIHRLAP
jgi:nondiscriminating aspartyl-tRNA synthetase